MLLLKNSTSSMFFCCVSLFSLILSGCDVNGYDVDKVPDFPAIYFPETPPTEKLDVNNLDLYVDYSTCVSTAFYDTFFEAIQPTITARATRYISIKGNQIMVEWEKGQSGPDVYSRLRSVKDVSYADLKTVVEQIVNQNRQAVLITDGEYFQKGMGSNAHNPYMFDAIKEWLKKGYSLLIYSEPYVEKYRGRDYNKYRYFFVFTDDSQRMSMPEHLMNNLEEKRKVFNATKNINVHLTNIVSAFPKLDREFPNSSQPYCNENFGTLTNYNRTDYSEVIDLPFSCADMDQFLLRATDENGNPDSKANYIIRGLIVDKTGDSSGCYSFPSLKCKAYNITDYYCQYYDSVNSESGLKPHFDFSELAEAKDVFVFNKRHYQQTKEVCIGLDANYQSYLDNHSSQKTDFQLFKVDVVVDSISNNFPQQEERFVFPSIDNMGMTNRSVYESINQALNDADCYPTTQKQGVVYTYYIKIPN